MWMVSLQISCLNSSLLPSRPLFVSSGMSVVWWNAEKVSFDFIHVISYETEAFPYCGGNRKSEV